MATTTQPVQTPLEVYLHSSFEPDAEFIDGVIEARPVGEFDHSSWQQALSLYFGKHEKDWNIRVRPELRIRVSATRFRVPDVTVLDRSLPVEQIITRPPIAVFEVMSPEDTVARTMVRLADYERMGIRTILVFDPHGQNFRYLDGKLELLAPAAFDLPGSQCRFDLAEIKKLLD
jgi:Uma2 family endonuclease